MLVERMLAANPATAVVVTGGGGVDMSRWADRAPAIVHALYPGMEGGTALGEIISGAVNPRPSSHSLSSADGRLPCVCFYDETRSDKKVYYGEGL